MTMRHTSRLLATTLALTMVAGCSSLPFSVSGLTSSPKTVTKATSTPFVSANAAGLALTSTSQVNTRVAAKVLATNDEGLVESTSAGLEATESAASYSVAGIREDMAAAEQIGPTKSGAAQDGFGPRVRPAAPPEGDEQPVPEEGAAEGDRPAFNQDRRGGQPPQQRPAQTQRQPQNQGRLEGDFEMGTFGGGFDMGFEGRARQPVAPQRMGHAQQPARTPKLDTQKTKQVEKRRECAQQKRQNFQKAHPQYSQDEQMIQQVLNSQPWQPTDDETVVEKSGSATLTLGTGVSRKIAVLRQVQAEKPHALVKGQTDIADVYADGATKTVHWEKALQEDGSYSIAYHHEYTTAKGVKWVADWTKTLSADGKVTGTGTFTETDADGKLVREETLTIGGTDASGETVTTTETTTPTETPTEETSTSTEETPATTEEEATLESAVPATRQHLV